MDRWATGASSAAVGTLADRVTNVEVVTTTLNTYVTDALNRVAGVEAVTPAIVRANRIITGGFNPLPNTTGAWQALTGFELALPAAVGEWVEIQADFLTTDGTSYLDLAVAVGSTLVRYGATGSSSPAAEGNPGWHPGAYVPVPGPFGFVVSPGDLDGGNVRFVLACKGNGTGRLYADATYPFRWRAINHRAVE